MLKEKCYTQKNLKKISNFQIKSKNNKSNINSLKKSNDKNQNQTLSTLIPTSRAQTSSSKNRKKYFINPQYILGGPYNLGTHLNYDVLFNKTEDDCSFNYSHPI